VASEETIAAADFELRDTVGHLIRVTQQVHFSLWGDGIGEDRLTSPQFAVLHVLAHQQPLDQRTVGDRASLDRSTVTDIVGRLVERGIVERTYDAADARRRLVRLTARGLMVHRAAAIRASAINESLLEAIDDGERDSLLRILNKILDHHNV
jgi:MarR family transcriptional regulator, temperature-dependent positive regulator of motility